MGNEFEEKRKAPDRMEISKRIQIGDYAFEVMLKSKSAHAHSLMTDCKENLESHLNGFISGLKMHPLPALIDKHKEGKG